MTIWVLFLFVVGIYIYFLPTTIAFARGHHYKGVIFVLNLFGFIGVTWVVAFIWAVWPRKTAIFSPLVNDLTTNDSESGRAIYGGLGKNIGSLKENTQGWEDRLLKLHSLKEKGVLTDEEFERKKREILG